MATTEYLVRDVVHYLADTIVDGQIIEEECTRGCLSPEEMMAWVRTSVYLRFRTCRWLQPSVTTTVVAIRRRQMHAVIRWCAAQSVLPRDGDYWWPGARQADWVDEVRRGRLGPLGSYPNERKMGWTWLMTRLQKSLQSVLPRISYFVLAESIREGMKYVPVSGFLPIKSGPALGYAQRSAARGSMHIILVDCFFAQCDENVRRYLLQENVATDPYRFVIYRG